jgi:23S rRNA-/tRNA-specific pseudouridylate synthase
MIQSCVLYRDEHIIALNKPPGLPVQGGSKQHRHVDGPHPLRCGSAITKTRGLCIVWIRTPPGF